MLEKYFPRDNIEIDTVRLIYVRRSKLKKRKATSNRVPNEAMQAIFEVIVDDIVDLFQQSWSRAVFPKTAEIVWIPKKDRTPRPISICCRHWERF